MIDAARLQAHLLASIDQGVIAFHPNGAFLFVNRAAEQLYGVSAEITVGRTLDDPQIADLSSVKEFKILTRVGAMKNWAGEMRLHRWDDTTFPALVNVQPIHEDGSVSCIIVACTDISERKAVRNQLERTIKRLENLRDIDRVILLARSPEAVAEAALKIVRQMVPCDQASITLVNSDTSEIKVLAQWTSGRQKFVLGKDRTANSARMNRQPTPGNVFVIDDTHIQIGSSPLQKALLTGGIRSFLRIPFMMADELIGALSLAAVEPGIFIREYRDIAQEIGAQLAVALHGTQLLVQIEQRSAELELRVAERTGELQAANELLQHEIQVRTQAQAAEHEQRNLADALRDTAAALTSTLNVEEVLDHILQNVGRVVPHDVADVLLINDGIAHVARFHGYTDPQAADALLALRLPVAQTASLQWMMQTGQALVIADVRDYPGWWHVWKPLDLRSYVGVPITAAGSVIGFIGLNSSTPGYFTARHAERLRIFADQASIALQNARLHEHSQELAATEERQRLSHELHDSVSQTLWSACMIADVLPELWEQNPVEGRKVLTRLSQLTRGALAEMRALLLELRSSALTEVGLETLLMRLAEVASSRTGIAILPLIEGKASLTEQVQVGIYRIAQEALNNIMKHSKATKIALHLHSEAKHLTLVIRDNGNGFATKKNSADHLGLKIMRERAQSIGAELDVESRIGKGTTITVKWPSPPSVPR